MDQWVLTLCTFVPALGAILVLLFPRNAHNAIRWFSAVVTFIPILLSVYILQNFQTGTSEFQFMVRADWIPAFNIQYIMGIDGLSVTMVVLTALLCFLCVFVSWNISKAVKGYFALFLLLEAGMMGVFCALDFFLFYVFWEVMLLPMYFLIGVWGGPQREYAAIKFFLYTLFGSVLMLLGMIALYFHNGLHSFDMTVLMEQRDLYSLIFQKWVYAALFVGFAIKVPIFPFHTWLPLAHVEAPTAISVILAGILLKMGTYGIFRISYSILPDAATDNTFRIALALLGLVNIIYGALVAMAQTDFKKLVAYSSVSHMGYCLLGMAAMTAAGLNGALLQMFNHGTSTAMLFIIVGVIYEREHHRVINDFGGLVHRMPVYTGISVLAIFSSLGLPGLNGFISEALVFLGSFPEFQTIVIISAVGIVLTAGYLLWLTQRVFLGPLKERYAQTPEINKREMFTLVPLAALAIFVGVYPSPVLKLMDASVVNLGALLKPELYQGVAQLLK